MTAFGLRPFVDFDDLAGFEALDGGLSLDEGMERASAVSSLRLLSNLGSWVVCFAWVVRLSSLLLLRLFFLCCRPRLSASFCFCKYGDVSLKAHYPEVVLGYLQRSFRRLGRFVRSSLTLTPLN